jgi:hypothetical protein
MSNDIINQLRAPFPEDRIEWRIQSCGDKQDGTVWARILAYIDNRSAMERLDEVFGLDWSHREEFHNIGNSAVCVVTITTAGRSVTGSCEVELNKADDIDPFKSAASGAMKRAVVNLGVGRYLYALPEAWAIVSDRGKHQGKTKSGTKFRWDPPSLSAADRATHHVEDVAPTPRRAEVITPTVTPPADAGDWRSVVIPFGKQQGKTLGSLPAASLKWWQDNYQPKPYKDRISDKDKAFRAALDASMAGKTFTLTEEEPSDDVPF